MKKNRGRKFFLYTAKGSVFIFIVALVVTISYITFFIEEISIHESATKVDPLPEASLNVLIIGVANGLSDTIMLCHYSPQANKVDIISIPRDTYYPREGYNHAAQKKINAVYGSEGPDGTVRSVEGLTGVNINYYMVINYKAVAQIVDAIGGIKVVVPHNMNYDDPVDRLHIHFNKGDEVKKGKDIVKLLRWRKNNHGGGYSEGDLGRIGMQQEIIKLGINKILSQNTVMNLIKIQKPVIDNVRTNMPPEKIMYYFSKLRSIDSESVNIRTLPVTPEETPGAYYYVVDRAKMEKMMEELKD